MTRSLCIGSVLLAVGVALCSRPGARADRDRDRDGAEIPYDDVRIFLEFNSTDNDLGVQVFLDGDAWRQLRIYDPRGRRILDLGARRSLGALGLTELFFESDEPSPEEVLALFRPGAYEFEGETTEGDELEGEATLSHELAPVPVIVVPAVTGEVIDPANAVLAWQSIPGIAKLEVIVENEDVGEEMLVPLPAAATTLHVPEEFLEPGTGYKVEVIAIAANGNKTISEREFVTGP